MDSVKTFNLSISEIENKARTQVCVQLFKKCEKIRFFSGTDCKRLFDNCLNEIFTKKQ